MLSGEVYDARLLPQNWDNENCDESTWDTPFIVIPPGGVIETIEIANLERTAILEGAIAAMEVANAALESQNAKLSKANKNLTQENAELKELPSKDMTAFFEDMTPATIYFNIGKTTLCPKELEHLDFLAKNIIATADQQTEVTITVM